MSNYIYTVTAITKDAKDSRCFGFYFELESAKHAVDMNYGGMEESYYEYIVIEKQFEGIHALAEQVKWYYWDLQKGWIECEKPKSERFTCIVNWNGVG